jgi:hypothetical protein
MSLPIIGSLIDLVSKFKSSPEERTRQAALEIEPLILQLQANLAEAQHPNFFVAGWRSAAGWVCVLGMFYQYIIYNLLMWVWAFFGVKGIPPQPLDVAILMTMLGTLLGVGTMRSYDKRQGTDTKQISK